MEVATTPPASPRPQGDLGGDSGVIGGYPGASASRNPFASADDVAGNPFLATAATAPPSPNPFELLIPAGATAGVDHFDLFQHFASAPASPERAAAIYAQFSSVDGSSDGHDSGGDDDGCGDFLHGASYSAPTVTSTVPFDWEEKPGKPKPSTAATATATANVDRDDADFDFGVLLDRTSQTPELTAADELFDEGKIRPLKPPPRLLNSGSVGSSPRSPMGRAAMWSPRLRSLVGPGADFDPFAAAMAKASKAPSPLGASVRDAAVAGTHTSPKDDPNPTAPPPSSNGWMKKWRLSDLLLFRRLSARGHAAGSISKEPVFKYSPVQRLGSPASNATADPLATSGGDGKRKKHGSVAEAAGGGMSAPPRKQSSTGCVRLNPGLQRLAKGLHGPSSHFGRRRAATATMTMGKGSASLATKAE